MKKIKFIKDYRNPYFEIEKSKDKDPKKIYYRLKRNKTVTCCLLDKIGNLILVNQFRPTIGNHTIEFPAGSINNYEKPFDAAKREILEETGHECKLINLGKSRILLDRENVQDHFFFGFDAIKKNDFVIEKGIIVKKFTLKQFKKLIVLGKFQSIVCLGLIQLINLNLNCNFLFDKWQEIQKKAEKFYQGA